MTLGNLPITALTRKDWAQRLIEDHARAGEDGRPWLLSSANGNVLARAAGDAEFSRLMTRMDAIDADGMPLVIASRYLAPAALPERVATTDFFHDAAAAGARSGLTFFLLGGTAEENLRARRNVAARHPGLKLFGQHGYFTPEEEPGILARIRACGTDVLWVGLGVPREQAFAVRHARALQGLTWIKTCGGLFNFLSGSAPRAPRWMQDAGLEWLFRLAHDPKRLFWRYLTTNAQAVWLLVKDGLRQRGRRAA